jgi:hypothetical protein
MHEYFESEIITPKNLDGESKWHLTTVRLVTNL